MKRVPHTLEELELILKSIVVNLDMTVVGKTSHTFSPQGLTLILLLAESHIALHTWPERGYVHVDLVSCRKVKGGKVEKIFEKEFGVSKKDITWIYRD